MCSFVFLGLIGGIAIASEQSSTQKIHVSVMNVSGDWEIGGDLPRQALLISLEGIVNKGVPRIYLLFDLS